MWKTGIRPQDILLPADPDSLDAILGRREQRSLTHHGIELNGLFYNSGELTILRQRLGSKISVEICVDDGDIGRIVVLSPDKTRQFTVPAVHQIYATGMTAWQHKVCKSFAARALKSHDSTGWLEAKAQIAEMIEQDALTKKARNHTRKRVARYLDAGAKPSPPDEVAARRDDEVVRSLARPSPTSAPEPDVNVSSSLPSLPQARPPARRFEPIVRQRGGDPERMSSSERDEI